MEPKAAKFAGRCNLCSAPIAAGTLVLFDKTPSGWKIKHPDCNNVQQAEEPKRKEINWTSEQMKVFEFVVDNSKGSALLQAVAGAGKTTVLEESAIRYHEKHPKAEILYLVFASKNRKEAQKRMPDYVTVHSFHSAGYAALSQRYDLRHCLDKDGDKETEHYKALIRSGQISDLEAEHVGGTIRKLVSLAKQNGVGTYLRKDTNSFWTDMIDHHDLDTTMPDELDQENEEPVDVTERIIYHARTLLNNTVADLPDNEQGLTKLIDFDDMVYLPFKLELAFPTYDLILVDEQQDANEVMRAMVRSMCRQGTRVIAVGDEHQACFGWRGADADSMRRIKDDHNATELTLSYNYRCGRAIVAEAQKYFPGIQAGLEDEGMVLHLQGMKVTDFEQSDVIISRVNANLVSLRYKLIANDIPCVLLGSGDGGIKGLVKRILGKKEKSMSIDVFDDKLSQFCERETTRLLAKGKEQQVGVLQDKVECLRSVMSNMPDEERTVADLLKKVERLFTQVRDDGKANALTLCTVHRVKGLEYDRVFVLDPQLMPSKWARRDWQLEQERNLQYVAATRARKALCYVQSVDITDR